jgi:hypothetical protein
MGSNNYLFELTSHQERPRYIALLATLAAPRTLFPVVTGAALMVVRFEVVFALLAAIGTATILMCWRLEEPGQTGPAGREATGSEFIPERADARNQRKGG